MKIFYKFLMLAVVGALAGPFILKDEYGRPLMSLDRLRLPKMGLPDFLSTTEVRHASPDQADPSLDERAKTTTVYKWRDATGVWHFSTSRDFSGAQELRIEGDHNVVRFETATVPTDQTLHRSGSPSETTLRTPFLGLEKAGDLVNQAREIDQRLESRYHAQEQAIDGH